MQAAVFQKPGTISYTKVEDPKIEPTTDIILRVTTTAICGSADTSFEGSLTKQLGPKGIRVYRVAPGPIWTALQVSGGATMEKLKNFGGDTPLAKPGQPVEMGSIVMVNLDFTA